MTVCVDASLVLAWLLPDEQSDWAYALQERWDAAAEEMIAPSLLVYEVTSVLRRAHHRAVITAEEAQEAFEAFRDMPIRTLHPRSLSTAAWELGQRTNASKLYDLYYVALAEMQDCDLWTGDKRLVNMVAGRSPRVRWIGDAVEAPNGSSTIPS